ncbi:glycosyltransferase family 4 protein [Achromobacter sp. F4_2707]|uniref:glycosyltransferase family 4 protein n=1 Tax=Achromobacter sp. F4_2707 TaxID=3114286 RepID=UPI0039C5BEBA
MKLNYPVKQAHLMIVIHSLAGGGAERVAVEMCDYWLSQGCRVTLVTQSSADTDAYPVPEGVDRRALGLAGDSSGSVVALWANMRRVAALRRLIVKLKPQVVLGMMTRGSVLAVLAAQRLPCRVIASEHTHPPVQRLPSIWQKLRRWAYPRAHAVVALTSGTAAWLEEHVPGSKVTVIPNSVRWPLESSEPVVAPPERAGRFRLLAVGRLHRLKGFDVLLRAFSQLTEYFPNWDLVILGEGAEREVLQQQIEELNLAGRVSMPGRVGNLADWYRESDLYVLSSRAEGLSNTLIEAMASGLPVVAFDCDTGPREIIRPDIDGVLVRQVEDADALAAHLAHLMTRPEEREALARRAIDVRDRFCVARVMTLWNQLFGFR